jgi:hypothetical protein
MGQKKRGCMDLDCIEQQLAEEFSGKWITEVVMHNDLSVRVSFGQNRKGEPTYRYWVDSARVTREVLLAVLCNESLCPWHQDTLALLRHFVGKAQPAPAQRKKASMHITALQEECRLEVDGKAYVARPAKLSCRWRCPVGAHSSIVFQRDGWDIFNLDGSYVAGGLDVCRPKDSMLPMFSTLGAAKTWLLVNQKANNNYNSSAKKDED